MIDLKPHAEGVVLPVRAQPGAKRSAIVGVHGGALKVAVAAPPQDGKANEALVDVLRDALGMKRSQVELIAGQTSRDKKFLIRGVATDWLRQRLAGLLE
jgi:uncharacterized protein (TIGR00251 family)